MNIQKHMARVREIEPTLAPFDRSQIPGRMLGNGPVFFLTSLQNEEVAGGLVGGVVCDIPNRNQAARLVAGGTHRASTTEEIQQYFANDERAVKECAAIEMKRKQQFAMPQELQTLVAAAAASLGTKRKGSEA